MAKRSGFRLVVSSGLLTTLAAALLVPFGPSAAAADDDRPCKVRNTATDKVHKSLPGAVKAARSGHRLVVTGVCGGRAVIGKDLRLEGRMTGGRWAKVTSNGDSYGLVFRPGVTATVANLTVSGVSGGIYNRGSLTLRDASVRGTWDWRPAIRNTGSLTLLGRSVVKHNVGSGIDNSGRLILGGRSLVARNGDPGVYNRASGTVIMQKQSRIGDAGFRVGTAVVNQGRFVMGGASSIAGHHNTDPAFVNRARGKLVMRGTSGIHHNTAGNPPHIGCERGHTNGGGVRNAGTLVMQDRSSIHHNMATFYDCDDPTPSSTGGGIHNTGTLRMTGSSRIYGNSVEGKGGGLYSVGGTLQGVRCGDNVYGNTPDDCVIK